MRNVTVAATQFKSAGYDRQVNIIAADGIVREAANAGAKIVLLHELFETNYFCQLQYESHFTLASTVKENPAVIHMTALARELGIVVPVSFFERCNNAYYNSLAVIDADGSLLGVYRKSHIPDGAGYQEKYYFNPGDTGFMVWDTAFARIGFGVCWDQWFPECARVMSLRGAEFIFYPTAIGTEPHDPNLDSRAHWQTCMRGHAAANLTPIITSNRIGREIEGESAITFYGSSFITDEHGSVIAELGRNEKGFITASFDLDELRQTRRAWGVFRDRRPDLYTPLLGQDGE